MAPLHRARGRVPAVRHDAEVRSEPTRLRAAAGRDRAAGPRKPRDALQQLVQRAQLRNARQLVRIHDVRTPKPVLVHERDHPHLVRQVELHVQGRFAVDRHEALTKVGAHVSEDRLHGRAHLLLTERELGRYGRGAAHVGREPRSPTAIDENAHVGWRQAHLLLHQQNPHVRREAFVGGLQKLQRRRHAPRAVGERCAKSPQKRLTSLKSIRVVVRKVNTGIGAALAKPKVRVVGPWGERRGAAAHFRLGWHSCAGAFLTGGCKSADCERSPSQ